MLTVEALSCSYGSARILEDVNLSVGQGEMVALLGRNGMGKTTLVRCLFGQTPPRITGGRVLFESEDLTHQPSHKIAQQGLGLVPQGRRVFPSLTVKENLSIVVDSAGPWTLEAIFELFPQLDKRMNARGGDLSGGEQQMLAIGRALATNPRLLVMDEASEGLAPIILTDIRKRLKLLKEQGLTTLLVEQNVNMALELADRIFVLGSHGNIVWSVTPEEFQASPDLQQEHLGV